MPEMDGLEATRRLKARGGAVAPKVIAMTASAMLGDREKCLAAGMDAYVPKPVELDQVRAVLIAVAGGATLQAAAAEAGADAATPVIDQRRIGQLLELQDEQQPALVADIIALFLADSPRHLETLAAAIRDGDAAQLESTAHRYLSGIENLGARRMRTHCMELERLARSGTTDAAADALELLASEFELAREPLAAIAKKYQ